MAICAILCVEVVVLAFCFRRCEVRRLVKSKKKIPSSRSDRQTETAKERENEEVGRIHIMAETFQLRSSDGICDQFDCGRV
jgi:hypothetical protein